MKRKQCAHGKPFARANFFAPAPTASRRAFVFWANDEEFYRVAAKTPRSNCILDVSKLLAAGVPMRPVEEALEDSLRQWKPLAKEK